MNVDREYMRCVGSAFPIRRATGALLLWLCSVLASAHPAADDYATPQLRTELIAFQQVFCKGTRRPVLTSWSALSQLYLKRLASTTSVAELLHISNRMLSLAQDEMGEGEADESWNLLCEVLAARMRALGPAAPRTVVVFSNFGVLLRKQGFVADSRSILQKLERIVRQYPEAGASLTHSVLHNLGTTLLFQGYLDEAETTLRRSLRYAGRDTDTTPTLTNIARTLEARNKWPEAEKLHRQVVGSRKVRIAIEPLEFAAALNNLGANLTKQGRASAGEPFIREGLRIRQAELPQEHLNIGYSLATLVQNLLEQNKPRMARLVASQLLQLRQHALGTAHSETAEAYRLVAEVALAMHAPSDALAPARAALDSALSLTRRETSGLDDDAKVTVRRDTAGAALTLVRAAWQASGTSKTQLAKAPALLKEAFLAAQRMSTSSTFEAVLSAHARSTAAVQGAAALANQFEAELLRHTRLDAALANAAAKAVDMNGLQTQLSRLEQQHSTTAARLRKAFPTYFDLVRPEPIAAESLAGFIQMDEVFVLLTPGVDRQRGFVWALTRDDLAWAEIPISADKLVEAVNQVRKVLDPGNQAEPLTGVTPAQAWSLGHGLYRALFGAPDVARLLAAKPRWMIAPQDILVSLPYNALQLTSPPDKLPLYPPAVALRRMRWLGLEKTISLLPSAGSLRVLRTRTDPGPSQPFFGVGDPYFPESLVGQLLANRSVHTTSATDLETLRQLDPLPGTRIEIEKLASLLGAPPQSYLLGKQANEKELSKRIATGQISDARIIAFATHGFMGGELSESAAEPSLALSPPDSISLADDGLLTASEIRQMKLRADWVLLSACNTAAGSRVGAEGLTGLARSFLYAGAGSLLISNWKVPDLVAPRLVTRAIELTRPAGRDGGMPKAMAVRESMQEIMRDPSQDDDALKTLAHPRAWAAFVYIGVN